MREPPGASHGERQEVGVSWVGRPGARLPRKGRGEPTEARVSEGLTQVEGVARLKVFKANENLDGAWPLGVGGRTGIPPL